ncbi:unnamed protein product [Pleuronectes platessa]|uniref:Uncharacterized protein n=1 Tax=Pleuronectes platessa TaxID=8262 RepID=A0A9N7YHE8_PLEPL|nr:unnamed protein product [Pleuronectes platessa]
MPDELSPAHNISGREVRSGVAPLGRNYARYEIDWALSGWVLYDDGQMINVHIQTRRHSSPQSPSTAAQKDPPRATAAVLVHHPYPLPTRHRVRHHHHNQPTRYLIRHTGSTTATPDARSTNRIHGA